MIIFVVAGIFAGQLGQLLSSSPVIWIAKAMPTYYIAEGIYNASQNLGTSRSNLIDLGVTLGSTIVLLAVSAWTLRRQSEVEANV